MTVNKTDISLKNIMDSVLKITIIQTSVSEKTPDENHRSALQKINSLTDGDLVILPELFVSGYNSNSISKTAENSQLLIDDYALAANQTEQAVLAGSLAVKEHNQIYNRSCFFNKSGLLTAKYDKIHLFKLLDEDKYFLAGNKITFFDYYGFRIGLMICYDLRFPELARLLAKAGCNLLIIPAAWPANRITVFKQLAVARAIENQLWVIAANRASSSIDKITYGGNSLVVAPDGEIIAEAGITNQIIRAEIDLERVTEYRKTIPCYEDIRNDVYELRIK